MTKASVPVFRNMLKSVVVDTEATKGAQVGINLLDPSGKLVNWSDILNPKTTTGSTLNSTDDLQEGQWNLYFTNKRAQDAVGGILVNTPDINLAYAPGVPSISAMLVHLTAIALTNLTYPMVVAVDGAGNAYYPDLTNPVDVSRIVGVTMNSALAGATVQIVTSRNFTEIAWSWSPGRIYCAVTGGGLTQTAPTTGAVVEVARVITPTSIRVGIQPAILR
jgi:hypothetical protein